MKLFVNVLQLIGGIILSIGYIPQILQIVRTKSVKDFNVFYLISLSLGIGLMEICAIYNVVNGVAIMFFVTNTVSLMLSTMVLILSRIYKNKSCQLQGVGEERENEEKESM